MSFEIQPTLALDADIRRIAIEQLDKAATELREPAVDRHEAIHDVRKRTKKLRALLRLVRSGDQALYKRENARLRDLARALSVARDRTALIEAAQGLMAAVGGRATPLRPFLKVLEHRRDVALAAEGDLDALIARTLDALAASRRAFEGLAFSRSGRRILGEGFADNFARARQALDVAVESGEAEDFHALRKRAKYHAHHLDLLQPLWPEAMKPLHKAASDVGDDLGRDHDYAVLLAEIASVPDAFETPEDRALAQALIAEHSAELRARALIQARRLFAEKPKAARRRIEALWRQARDSEATPSV